MSAVYSAQGKEPEAIECLEEALRISKKRLGHDHPQVAGLLYNLPPLYGKQGKDSEALEVSKESLRIREKMLGGDHPDVSTSHSSVGVALTHLAEYKGARTHNDKALGACAQALGEESKEVAKVWNYMAELSRLEVHTEQARGLSGAPCVMDGLEEGAGWAAVVASAVASQGFQAQTVGVCLGMMLRKTFRIPLPRRGAAQGVQPCGHVRGTVR
eukprot:CAMPEP_0206246886 /NCGR_PEP_ID=MMETSP0047_2-20121206/19510_1 /ASSEMBLY_ACC=CAM_ASM_000192 /TAXON_ID=195065 /ORGANISM="Chroomonas mesostigmatica_cf, Strain CCMP1168" /LENGTH=213 /DNA_ID=CAMNT_0053672363 /DNA_START=26 /DNA_END=663 /DNA_ORIENTATION=+